jgi:pimeloyl-ACP methyl ester carboxylesterase
LNVLQQTGRSRSPLRRPPAARSGGCRRTPPPGGTASRLAWLLLLAAVASGCASPVGVTTARPREIRRYLTQSALTSDDPSTFSQIELRRYDLLEAFGEDPDAALTRLHELALERGLPAEALFALAELSFLHAERTRDPGRFAAAALYAYAYLFPEEEREPLDPLDPRSRVAADVYNRALAGAFQRTRGGEVVMRAGGLDLPFGHFTPELGPPPDLGGYAIRSLHAVAELEVSGLRNRYRHPGIGAPLAAKLAPTPESEMQPVPIAPSVQVPLTAVVRVDAPLAQIRSGHVTGRIDLFSTSDVETVEIAGRRLALEAEPTAALAAGLSESRFWQRELSAFLGNLVGSRGASGIASLSPYRPGRIPVVFVHGTASSAARWADMGNDLVADARIRHRFALWFFYYDSGNPIPYSAWRLRDALTKAVARADPAGSDPCLRDMVVLGHSQGGLLTKMTSIDAGDRFWRMISDRPFEETKLPDETRELVEDLVFVEPLPFVRRVIFLATPHRGSYLAGPQIVRRLAQRLVRLPADVVRAGAEIASVGPTGALAGGRVATSIDNMSPGNRFIRALAEVPVVPAVTAHSIISVNDDGPLEDASDGVVRYTSAHVEGVESELIVQSPHSGMQAAPATIEEVRRILLEHSAASACPPP